ncbi:hypothetical protein IFM89_023759 [Coptis chinensis]|uniref:Uncharacterized protein n=1 Tax=Coptis chinensis TaxID=261450 RepID=A0A835GXM4_9MAGN|nr:hypothetical protein IFM89_023759 [Coptis chinensis]
MLAASQRYTIILRLDRLVMVLRDSNDNDLNTMQLLHAVSMGASLLPSDSANMPDGELTYMRTYLECVVGSKDFETFYMMNPDGNSGPELNIFFVRII